MGFGLAIGSVLLIGPLFGIWSGNLSDKELDKNGIIQKGVVTKKWYVKHNNGNDEWLYRAAFNVNKKTFFTFSQKDVNNAIQVGDTILIKYSKNNPENNEILDRRNYR